MRRLAGIVIALLALAAGAGHAATLDVGDPAPPLEDLEWITGGQWLLPRDGERRIVVLEFWSTTCGPCIASIPELSALRRQYDPRGVRVVAVTRPEVGNTKAIVERFVQRRGDEMDYAVAFDAEQTVYRAYMDAAGEIGVPTAFIIDADGRIAWIGHPRASMERVIERVLAGTLDDADARDMRRVDEVTTHASRTGDWEALARYAVRRIEVDPHSAYPWLLRHMAVDWLHQDHDAARTIVREAIATLRSEPDQLVRYVELALMPPRSEGRYDDLAADAMAAIPPETPTLADLHKVTFLALDRVERGTEARAAATRMIEAAHDQPFLLSRYALMLGYAAGHPAYDDLALGAVETAVGAKPHAPEIIDVAVRLRLRRGDAESVEAARTLARRLVVLRGNDVAELNTLTWSLLTNEAYQGKLNDIALEAAHKLMQKCGDDHAALDTVALAMFENGLVVDAIEIQRRAVALGGDTDPGYRERLARYEAAADG
ncbi:MAG: redoxin domain-containing protein [Planctomycetota bacterium]|jgi:thiol-disulfide isomerase/thioredoxin